MTDGSRDDETTIGYTPRGSNIVEKLNEYARDHKFIAELGATVDSYEDGTVRMSVPYNEKFKNPGMGGPVHGGVLLSVLDTVMGFTLMATAGEDGRTSTGPTISLTTNFLTASSEPLEAVGELVRMGQSTAVIDGTLIGRESGERIATAQGVWRVYRERE
ncbi:PaaI family thioesterase [Halosolutus halophilus]|uniref:PaaI family thioesterase n=1 Tax=Halosolutus halophilus TaxID=1552990 RepID=UPI0022351458|nr:PaaI family thioesterase [Halosolutus halophilus]